jgi:hypothetical protein
MIAALALAAAIAGTPPVSPQAADGTPTLPGGHRGQASAAIEQVLRCGGTMYAAGNFRTIEQGGHSYARDNAFSFSASSPYHITSWKPAVHGGLGAVALSPGCATAYLGGSDGVEAVSTSTGRPVRGFHASVPGTVDALSYWRGHLLAGGQFAGALRSLNPATGDNDGFTYGSDIRGSEPPGHLPTKIWRWELSPGGQRLLIEGDFTSAYGHRRQQIMMLNLTPPHGRTAQLTPWYNNAFNGQCVRSESFWLRDAAWSPDGTRIYIATTGNHPFSGETYPHTGLCDAYAAYSSQWTGNAPQLWRYYFGCDSAYSVGVSGTGVGFAYFAGHFRWLHNAYGCNHGGLGSIPDNSLAGVHGRNGQPLMTNGHASYSAYSANWDYMRTTKDGLWMVGTNRYSNRDDRCGSRQQPHVGLCFLPDRG